jgi:hypothetical protein
VKPGVTLALQVSVTRLKAVLDAMQKYYVERSCAKRLRVRGPRSITIF